MGAEGDIVHGKFAWDGIALHSSNFFRFIHDVLFARGYQRCSQSVTFVEDVKDSKITRDGRTTCIDSYIHTQQTTQLRRRTVPPVGREMRRDSPGLVYPRRNNL